MISNIKMTDIVCVNVLKANTILGTAYKGPLKRSTPNLNTFDIYGKIYL